MLVEKFDVAAGFVGSQAAVGVVDVASRFAVTLIAVVGFGESADVGTVMLPSFVLNVPSPFDA